MQWQRGTRRLQVAGLTALLLGVALLFTELLTGALGYSPDIYLAPLFGIFRVFSFLLIPIGTSLLVLGWILAGFFPSASEENAGGPPR